MILQIPTPAPVNATRTAPVSQAVQLLVMKTTRKKKRKNRHVLRKKKKPELREIAKNLAGPRHHGKTSG